MRTIRSNEKNTGYGGAEQASSDARTRRRHRLFSLTAWSNAGGIPRQQPDQLERLQQRTLDVAMAYIGSCPNGSVNTHTPADWC